MLVKVVSTLDKVYVVLTSFKVEVYAPKTPVPFDVVHPPVIAPPETVPVNATVLPPPIHTGINGLVTTVVRRKNDDI